LASSQARGSTHRLKGRAAPQNLSMTETRPPGDRLEQWRMLLEQVEGRLKVQFDEVDGLDRKATTGVAATGVILGLVGNNVATAVTLPVAVTAIFYLALIVLAEALFMGVYALWPERLWAVPEPTPLLAQHAASTPQRTIGELLSTKAAAYDLNVRITRVKADRVRVQILWLAMGAGLLVLAFVVERLAT
jgi:hypothetical protein